MTRLMGRDGLRVVLGALLAANEANLLPETHMKLGFDPIAQVVCAMAGLMRHTEHPVVVVHRGGARFAAVSL